MKAYMGALVKMNKTGTEYVRGIPVVKVFQQTVYSFKLPSMRSPNTPTWHKLCGHVLPRSAGTQPYRAQWSCGIPVARGVAVGAGRDGLRTFYGQLHVFTRYFRPWYRRP